MPECGHEVSSSANACPQCGAPVKKSKMKAQFKPGCLGWVVILFILFAVAGSMNDKNDKNNQTKTVRKTQDVKKVCSSYNSPWDGSVSSVKIYLEKMLRDPDSFDAIEWSPISELGDGRCIVRCKYRAKNSFGGYVIENRIFYLDKDGNVTGSAQW